MIEPLTLHVRCVDGGPFVLTVNVAGLPQEFILNRGQARNLILDLLPMFLGPSTIISREIDRPNGKPSAGKSTTPSVAITDSSRFLENGKAQAPR